VAFGYLGGVGPGVAALIVLRVCHGQHGIRRLARSLLAWGVLLTAGTVMATYPIGPYMLEIMAIAVIYTWLYNASLVIPILFHAAWNTLPAFSTPRVVLTVAIATLLVVRYGPQRLASRSESDTPPTAGSTAPFHREHLSQPAARQ